MRLGVEQAFATIRASVLDFTHKRNMSDLTIIADTIVPSTPQRVETIVDGERDAVQPKPITLTDTVPKTDLIPRDKVATKVDSVSTRVMPKDTVQPVAVTPHTQTLEQEPVGETSFAREMALPHDTLAYPQAMDSVAMDSVTLTPAREVFSMEGHKEGILHPIKLDRSDGIFALLVICFLLLAHVYNGGMAFFKENIMLVFSASKSEKLDTQTTTKEMVYSYFLVFLAVLLISISLYEGLDRFMPLVEGGKRPFVTIGLFVMLILVFVVAKMFLNRVIGFIFDFGKQIETWNRSYLVLFSMLGLLCFFPTLMLVYSSYWSSIVIGFVLVLFLIVQFILFFRLIVFFIEQKFNLLSMIAYLCTIEILPYIFLGIGLVHLYKTDIFNTIL